MTYRLHIQRIGKNEFNLILDLFHVINDPLALQKGHKNISADHRIGNGMGNRMGHKSLFIIGHIRLVI